MDSEEKNQLVVTIPEHCRMCYTCIRECPAKAIRVYEGQAQVVPERCIGCGNCVRVCSQDAKQVLDCCDAVQMMLQQHTRKTIALMAPSFPAEFSECEPEQVVGALRTLGFDVVAEVAFGADLVARAYRELLEAHKGKYIATSCPAVVGFVERYHPELVPYLAPIVSPMVAAARVMHQLHGKDTRIVFIGPCLAKKAEVMSELLAGELDAALTFKETRNLFDRNQVDVTKSEVSRFDPPFSRLGALFPISRGLLQAADIREDLLESQVVATDGRESFVSALDEFEHGHLDANLLEILCCNGCIMGAGMTNDDPKFSRRTRVSNYAKERCHQISEADWEAEMKRFADLDLSRKYAEQDQRLDVPSNEKLSQILKRLGKYCIEDELNCGACGYSTCREHALAIHKGLAESEMCLPYAIEKLRNTVGELAASNQELAETQEALMHSERLASMGQLAAGVAHEVNNPLGVVLMYAHMLREDLEDAEGDMSQDLSMIVEQADRCKKIVSRLLNFARQNKLVAHHVNLKTLVGRTLASFRLPEHITTDVITETETLCAEIDPDQMMQVFSNLITNAKDVMQDGGHLKVTIRNAPDAADKVQLVFTDSGPGIPKGRYEKIFEPFFTTKQIGKGTGLGLSVIHGIVKMHRGSIEVRSNADPEQGPTWTSFVISLPRVAGEGTQPHDGEQMHRSDQSCL